MLITKDNATEAFLEHVGVKGMRWGHRKAEDSAGSSSGSEKPKKLTRKEVRAEKNEFYVKKGDNIVRTAAKHPDSLIAIRNYGDYVPTIVTGKELLEHMAKGGLLDVKNSDVYATKNQKTGEYWLNENMNQRFVRSDKKKK